MKRYRFFLSIIVELCIGYICYISIPAKTYIKWSVQLGLFTYVAYPLLIIVFFIIIDTLISRLLSLADKMFGFFIRVYYGVPGKATKQEKVSAKKAAYAIFHSKYEQAARHFSNAGLHYRAALCFEKINDTPSAAQAYLLEKRYKDAADKFFEIKKFESAAECYIKMGDRKSAIKCFHEAGEYLLSQGKTVMAAEAFLGARDYEKAGELLEKSNHFIEAAETYEKIGNFRKAALLYLKSSKDMSQKQQKQETYRNQSPKDNLPLEYARKALKLFQKLGFSEEILEVYEILEDFDKIADIYIERGDLEKAAGIYEKAEKWQRARNLYNRLGKENEVVLMDANMALQNKQWKKAAILFQELKDYEKALEIFKQIHDNAGQAYCLEKLDKPVLAAGFYIKCNNNLKAAELYDKAGNYKKAAELYRELGMLEKASFSGAKSKNLFFSATLEREKGNIKAAIEILRTIPHYHSDYASAMLLLGQCYLDLDNFSLAADTFERVIPNMVPTHQNIENFYLYACILEKTENYDYALELFQKIQSTYPDYKDVNDRIQILSTILTSKTKITLEELVNKQTQNSATSQSREEDDKAISQLKTSKQDIETVLEDQKTLKEESQTIVEDLKTISKDYQTFVEGPSSHFYEQKTIIMEESGKPSPAKTPSSPERFQKLELLSPPESTAAFQVFKVRDRDSGVIMALKTFSSQLQLNEEDKTMCQGRLEKLAPLEHPNIVTLYEIGELNQEFYICMEYCEGGNLQELIDHDGALSPNESLQMLQIFCDVLEYSHSHGMVHGGIKPSNILFTKKGLPKLSDFCQFQTLCDLKQMKNILIKLPEKQRIKTLHYLSPEQIEMKTPGQNSDIYSLGLILFFMLVGRSLFELMQKNSYEEIVQTQKNRLFLPPSQYIQNSTPQLDEICMGCIKGEFRTAGQLSKKIKSLL